jgi:uncharacterized protein YcbK (DUF882 family)
MILFQAIAILVVVFLSFPVAGSANSLLRARRDSQVIQNEQADADRLARLEDREMLDRFTRLELLSEVPVRSEGYYLHGIPDASRFARPWTKLFVERLGRQFHNRFGKPLRVTSLVRTVAYQNALRRRNRNAASPYGPKRSSHLTGASLDISKKGLRASEIAWLRQVLASLKEQGYLFAIEEFKQPNFHIMVYRNYLDYAEEVADAR